MKLITINKWLARVGLILVVEDGYPGHPTKLWITPFSRYIAYIRTLKDGA